MFGKRPKEEPTPPAPVEPAAPVYTPVNIAQVAEDPFLREVYLRAIMGFAGNSYVSDVAYNALRVAQTTAQMMEVAGANNS